MNLLSKLSMQSADDRFRIVSIVQRDPQLVSLASKENTIEILIEHLGRWPWSKPKSCLIVLTVDAQLPGMTGVLAASESAHDYEPEEDEQDEGGA